MELSQIINSIGLSFDIIGAVIIFKYGVPEKTDLSGSCVLIVSDDKEEEKETRKYRIIGKIGALMLIIGFVLQIFSNFIK